MAKCDIPRQSYPNSVQVRNQNKGQQYPTNNMYTFAADRCFAGHDNVAPLIDNNMRGSFGHIVNICSLRSLDLTSYVLTYIVVACDGMRITSRSIIKSKNSHIKGFQAITTELLRQRTQFEG